jgi:hypothetical protein
LAVRAERESERIVVSLSPQADITSGRQGGRTMMEDIEGGDSRDMSETER